MYIRFIQVLGKGSRLYGFEAEGQEQAVPLLKSAGYRVLHLVLSWRCGLESNLGFDFETRCCGWGPGRSEGWSCRWMDVGLEWLVLWHRRVGARLGGDPASWSLKPHVWSCTCHSSSIALGWKKSYYWKHCGCWIWRNLPALYSGIFSRRSDSALTFYLALDFCLLKMPRMDQYLGSAFERSSSLPRANCAAKHLTINCALVYTSRTLVNFVGTHPFLWNQPSRLLELWFAISSGCHLLLDHHLQDIHWHFNHPGLQTW